MATPRFEVALGVSDGVNLVFFTPTAPYLPGSVAVFLNGQLKRADFMDGWVETNPVTGEVDLLIAPLGGAPPDVVQIFYLDDSVPVAGVPEAEITRLHGTVLDTVDVYAASLATVFPLRAFVQPVADEVLNAMVRDVSNVLSARLLETTTVIHGTISVC